MSRPNSITHFNISSFSNLNSQWSNINSKPLLDSRTALTPHYTHRKNRRNKMPRSSFAKVDVVIDTGSPLLDRTVDGFFKIGTVIISLFLFSYNSLLFLFNFWVLLLRLQPLEQLLKMHTTLPKEVFSDYYLILTFLVIYSFYIIVILVNCLILKSYWWYEF